MSMTDPIADLLTRIRNAIRAGHLSLRVPGSRIKSNIVGILPAQGYMDSYEIKEGIAGQNEISIQLLEKIDGKLVLNELRRISKPGRRVYVNKGTIPRVLNGMGIAILSTSRGLVTDDEARNLGVGGEVICEVW